MNVKVKFIEAVWDNYQGASGKPIVHSMIMEVPDDTRVDNLIYIAVSRLHNKGFNNSFNVKGYTADGIISVSVLPILE